MYTVKPHYIELHAYFGLRARLNRHENIRKVRKDTKGFYVICWKWSKMKMYIDPKYIPEVCK